MLKLSLIIVNYHSQRVLWDCLASLPKSFSFEVIVVDNDESPTIKPLLAKDFPSVIYMKSGSNIGYGSACNLGSVKARGKYLFFLNPDVIFYPSTIRVLTAYLDLHQDVAAVSPLLLNSQGRPYPWVGTSRLTPLKAIFSMTVIHKLWPENPIARSYWVRTNGLTAPVQVGVAPGTALLIRASVFHRIGGYDHRFFLYFEESDLCLRINSLGLRIFLLPEARLIHLWGASTPQTKQTKSIFAASRFYYFRKHFGLIAALAVEVFCRL